MSQTALQNEDRDSHVIELVGHVRAFQVHHQIVMAAARTNDECRSVGLILGRKKNGERGVVDVLDAVKAVGGGIPLFWRDRGRGARRAIGPKLDDRLCKRERVAGSESRQRAEEKKKQHATIISRLGSVRFQGPFETEFYSCADGKYYILAGADECPVDRFGSAECGQAGGHVGSSLRNATADCAESGKSSGSAAESRLYRLRIGSSVSSAGGGGYRGNHSDFRPRRAHLAFPCNLHVPRAARFDPSDFSVEPERGTAGELGGIHMEPDMATVLQHPRSRCARDPAHDAGALGKQQHAIGTEIRRGNDGFYGLIQEGGFRIERRDELKGKQPVLLRRSGAHGDHIESLYKFGVKDVALGDVLSGVGQLVNERILYFLFDPRATGGAGRYRLARFRVLGLDLVGNAGSRFRMNGQPTSVGGNDVVELNQCHVRRSEIAIHDGFYVRGFGSVLDSRDVANEARTGWNRDLVPDEYGFRECAAYPGTHLHFGVPVQADTEQLTGSNGNRCRLGEQKRGAE